MGLLLREVADGVQGCPEIRQLAVATLKNLMIKHTIDDRYNAFKVSYASVQTCIILQVVNHLTHFLFAMSLLLLN